MKMRVTAALLTLGLFWFSCIQMAYATGKCMCDAAMNAPFTADHVCDMVRHVYSGRVDFHNGDGFVAPGVTVHHVPGHSKGLQCVRVMTEQGPVVIASDAAHFYENDVFSKDGFYGPIDIVGIQVEGCNDINDDGPPYEWVCSGQITVQCKIDNRRPEFKDKFFVRHLTNGSYVVRNEYKLCEYRDAGCESDYPILKKVGECKEFKLGPGYCINW